MGGEGELLIIGLLGYWVIKLLVNRAYVGFDIFLRNEKIAGLNIVGCLLGIW